MLASPTTATPRSIFIAAAVLVGPDRRVLLVRKRGTEIFMQPGGKLEPGEAPEQALVRELREELALEIDPGTASYLGSFSAPAAPIPVSFGWRCCRATTSCRRTSAAAERHYFGIGQNARTRCW